MALVEITPQIRQITQDALDSLLALPSTTGGGLGKNCRLVYPPKPTPCVDCVFDPIGQKSSNRWVTGGPVPFPDGAVCPLCNGVGQRFDEVTEDVTMQVATEPAHFFIKVAANVQLAAGTIQTKAFATIVPKILRAQQMILQPGQTPVPQRYVLDGEPVFPGSIVQGRYAIMLWKRAG